MSSPRKSKVIAAVVEEKKIEIAAATYIPKDGLHIRDINQLIADFSEYKGAACLAQTCRFLYHHTRHPLHVRKLKELAHYGVVEPNEDKVVALLSSNPTLINVVIPEIIDNSGRILINNTIFQLAYGAGDPEMCLAIKPFFIQVYGSEEAAIREMEKQRAQKFAEDKAADERQDKQAKDHLAALLKPVIAVITVEQFNLGKDAKGKLILSPETLAAIETFRVEFAKSQPKRIEKGMHFRNNTLLETFNAYVRAAAQWGRDYKRCGLFEDGILSCVLLAAPANDAQRFSQGLDYLQNCGKKFTRIPRKNNFYLACRSSSVYFSLTGYYVNIVFGIDDIFAWFSLRVRYFTEAEFLSNLLWNKNKGFAELMQLADPQPKSHCLIC